MLFSELQNLEHAEFAEQNPAVVRLAVSFGKQLELDCPDWLKTAKKRGQLEIIPQVGAVIARDVLSFDLIGAIYEEQVRKGVYMSQSANGVWFYSNFQTKKPTSAPHEVRLDDAYQNATGCTPNQMMNRYEHRGGLDGYQFPHTDRGLINPTVIFGKGPGATRVVGGDRERVIPRTAEGTVELGRLKEARLAFDLNTGVYDITIFDGSLFTHQGLRLPAEPETEEPRISLMLNSISPYN